MEAAGHDGEATAATAASMLSAVTATIHATFSNSFSATVVESNYVSIKTANNDAVW